MKEATRPAQLEAARRGSEAATAAIITRFMPYIRHYSRLATAPGLDFDDAVQEGLIGLFSAIQHYSDGQAATFTTYALVCVQNSITSARRAASRKKHSPLNYSVPISDTHSIPGPEEATIANEQVSLTLEKARTTLSPMEKTVLRLYLDGYSYQQIAQKIARTEKAVDNALLRVRRKLR